MKKVVLFFLIGLFSLPVVSLKAVNSFALNPDVVITIKLRLRSKSSECERGFGFCRVTININWEDNMGTGGEGVVAKASINAQKQLILSFNESDLKKYDNGASMKYFEGKESVYVDSDYELPMDVSKSLGSPNIIAVKQGTYTIQYDQGVYRLIIPL
jgi:hypothetical protein